MAVVLDKKPETEEELLNAIIKVSADKNSRILLTDQCEWLQRKLDEIGKFARKLKRMQSARRAKCRGKR